MYIVKRLVVESLIERFERSAHETRYSQEVVQLSSAAALLGLSHHH